MEEAKIGRFNGVFARWGRLEPIHRLGLGHKLGLLLILKERFLQVGHVSVASILDLTEFICDLRHAPVIVCKSVANIGRAKEAIVIVRGLRNIPDDLLAVRVQHHTCRTVLHNLRVIRQLRNFVLLLALRGRSTA